jgi:transcriptional regulator with XRE-family HTH domain
MREPKVSRPSLVIEMGRTVKKSRTHRETQESFGQRLRRIREARGLSQEQFGQAIGVSQRMLAYYENHAEKAPAHHLMQMAGVLRVSIDELIGYKPFEAAAQAAKPNPRLWNKLRQVESLPPKERKQVLQFIETLVERETLRTRRGKSGER